MGPIQKMVVPRKRMLFAQKPLSRYLGKQGFACQHMKQLKAQDLTEEWLLASTLALSAQMQDDSTAIITRTHNQLDRCLMPSFPCIELQFVFRCGKLVCRCMLLYRKECSSLVPCASSADNNASLTCLCNATKYWTNLSQS